MPDLEIMRRTRRNLRLNRGHTTLGYALHRVERPRWPDVVDGVMVLEWVGPPDIGEDDYLVLTIGTLRPYLADAELGAE